MNYNEILEELHTEAIEKKDYTNKLNPKTLQNIKTIRSLPNCIWEHIPTRP